MTSPSSSDFDKQIKDLLPTTTTNKNNYGAIINDNDTEKDGLLKTKKEPSSSHSMMGIILIILGSFSFSIMFLLVKLMEGKADSFTLVFYRSIVQIIISLGAIVRNHENPLGATRARGWLLVRGGFGAGAVIAWFFGIQNLPLPDAVTLQFTTPVFAAVFAVCLAGEEWKRLDMIGAFVCLLGVAFIAHPTWLFGSPEQQIEDADSQDDPKMKGLAVGVTTAGAAMAGLAYVSVRLIGDGTSANVMVLYYACLSIPISIFGSYWLEDKWNVWGDGSFSVLDYFLLLLTGFAGYGGQFFTNLGLQQETAATGTLATSTQIVWTYIFELAFLHEGINGWSLTGTGLILGFMLIVGASKMKESQASVIDNADVHPKVAGETEAEALLYDSERPV